MHMLTFPIPTARVCVSSKGIVDTAIGGQRIEEFLVNDTTINSCSNSRVDAGVWNGQLWAKMVMPFVDTTVKGWAWYVLHTINNLISTLFFFFFFFIILVNWRTRWSAPTPLLQCPLGFRCSLLPLCLHVQFAHSDDTPKCQVPG